MQERKDEQHINEQVEGVTIHIEPMGPKEPHFVVRLAVNGVCVDSMYGVTNAMIPGTVARLLQKGATQYASERPDWIRMATRSAAIGAFRKIFQRGTGS